MTIIQTFISTLQKLPGVGPRASQKLALHLLQSPDLLAELGEHALQAHKSIQQCSFCSNIDTVDPCSICADSTRTRNVICVVENISDIWALERSNIFQGIYFSLNGNLSSKTYAPTMERLTKLIHHTETHPVEEIILALSNTFDGHTTSQVLLQKLSAPNIHVSQLAQGIPVGAELDYLDRDTLTISLNARKHFR